MRVYVYTYIYIHINGQGFLGPGRRPVAQNLGTPPPWGAMLGPWAPRNRTKIGSKIHAKNDVVLGSSWALFWALLGAQVGPRSAQEAPKIAPRGAKIAPRPARMTILMHKTYVSKSIEKHKEKQRIPSPQPPPNRPKTASSSAKIA